MQVGIADLQWGVSYESDQACHRQQELFFLVHAPMAPAEGVWNPLRGSQHCSLPEEYCREARAVLAVTESPRTAAQRDDRVGFPRDLRVHLRAAPGRTRLAGQSEEARQCPLHLRRDTFRISQSEERLAHELQSLGESARVRQAL